jgi:hypothetical protein
MEILWGQSLRKADLFKRVRQLIETRNRIAHRGEIPDTETATTCVGAAFDAFRWLDALGASREIVDFASSSNVARQFLDAVRARAWQQWQRSAFARVRSVVRSTGGIPLLMRGAIRSLPLSVLPAQVTTCVCCGRKAAVNPGRAREPDLVRRCSLPGRPRGATRCPSSSCG